MNAEMLEDVNYFKEDFANRDISWKALEKIPSRSGDIIAFVSGHCICAFITVFLFSVIDFIPWLIYFFLPAVGVLIYFLLSSQFISPLFLRVFLRINLLKNIPLWEEFVFFLSSLVDWFSFSIFAKKLHRRYSNAF